MKVIILDRPERTRRTNVATESRRRIGVYPVCGISSYASDFNPIELLVNIQLYLEISYFAS